MLNRVKNAFYNVMVGLDNVPAVKESDSHDKLKFRYTRPHFLQLTTDDEVQVSADHAIRPIIVPRDINKLPWNTGYAEAINAGKSLQNEDQAAFHRGLLTLPPENPPTTSKSAAEKPDFTTPPSTPEPGRTSPAQQQASSPVVTPRTIPWVYLALFDGHAGSGVAVASANTLHRIIQEKLENVVDLLLPPPPTANGPGDSGGAGDCPMPTPASLLVCPRPSVESLVTGALEAAFHDMDLLIEYDKRQYRMSGGCTVLVAVFILGKLYLANAGDSRAIICKGKTVVPMSCDFTPESERSRVKQLGFLRPELLGDEFTRLEFIRRPTRKDIGKNLLYRDSYMTGWAYKMITIEDLKFPLVFGEGKRSRVLATIGVTRGFGDHDLKAQNSDVDIKPFLSSQPEVKVYDLVADPPSSNDVLVMGTDGLWDVTSNQKVAEVVFKALEHFPAEDNQRFKYRYISAAQDLVMSSRGKLRERNWKTSDNKLATIDDISVFVIPLLPYLQEYLQWSQQSLDGKGEH